MTGGKEEKKVCGFGGRKWRECLSDDLLFSMKLGGSSFAESEGVEI